MIQMASSSSSRTPGPSTAVGGAESQAIQQQPLTRSMSRRSSIVLSSLANDHPSASAPPTHKSSLPSARRIGPSSHSSTSSMPRTRSSTSLAARSGSLTGKSVVSNLSTSRARRVLSENHQTRSTSSSSSFNISNRGGGEGGGGVKRSASTSIASIRSPPRQGVRRYSRAEAGGLTGFGVVKAGPRVVSPVKLERESNPSRLGGPGGAGTTSAVNDPYSTSFQRPTFSFESMPSESQLQLQRGGRSGGFAIREDSKDSDGDELYLQSPRKVVGPFSPSKQTLSPDKTSSSRPPLSPFKSASAPSNFASPLKRRPALQGAENEDLDPTITLPIRPSSPRRGALSPRSLLRSEGCNNVPSQTLRRTKPSRKIDEVESSSDSDQDEFDFLSPRKKAKLPSTSSSSSTTVHDTLPRSAPATASKSGSSTSRVARARTSTGSSNALSTSTKTIDRSQLLRSPPPKKPINALPTSPTLPTIRPSLSSVPMQRTAGRAFPLPSSFPPVPSSYSAPSQSLRQDLPSSRHPIQPRSAPINRPLATSSSSSALAQVPPSNTTVAASFSRLPRRISNENSHSNLATIPPPPPPPPSAPSALLARSTSPTFNDPSVSLMSIDESQETSFSGSTIGDVSTISSTTSVRSEETAKRLANLQNMLSRLQMPRKSVSGSVGSDMASRRSSIESTVASGNSSILNKEERGGDSISMTRQRGLSASRLPSTAPRPRGGIVDTSSSSFRRPSISSVPSTSSVGPTRRISSSFLPSQSFDMSSTSSMSEISMLENDESTTEVFSEPTIKVQENHATSSSVLKGVVAFVDVRTGDGDDSGMIFVDMLKGMGARVTTRLSSFVTHVIFKSGKPSTLSYVRCRRACKPTVVGIAWVVKCVEMGQKVDEKPFLIVEEKKEVEKENSLFAIGAGKTVPAQKRRRSMEPKALAALNSSASSTGSSKTALTESIAASLARARNRSLRYAPKVGSPLVNRVFVMPDNAQEEEEDE
ncbi:hypothetical protein JCM3765_003054 [Sporobolomyces pararoseus]